MRSHLISISRLLLQVEKKAARNPVVSHSHRIQKVSLDSMDDTQIYDHIIKQISFIHFPELAYLNTPKFKPDSGIVKSEKKVRMMRDIGN